MVVKATTESEMAVERCGACGRAYVEITLDVGGRTLTMQSCSHCDTRRWLGPEGELALDGVLDTISEATARR